MHTHTLRRGAAVVELALVLPVLLILLVGSIEIGSRLSARSRCCEAARAGARVYSMQTTKTEANVLGIVDQIMQESKLKNYTVTLDPPPSSQIEQLDSLTVTVSVSASDATWHASPWFISADRQIVARCTMPADLAETAEEDDVQVPPVIETPTLIDEDTTKERGGVTAKELEKLEKEAEKQVKKARDLREKAEAQQQKADAAAAQAAQTGDPKDIQKAVKEQAKADQANAEATAEEKLARELLDALTAATAAQSTP
jgi:hypothetical protein